MFIIPGLEYIANKIQEDISYVGLGKGTTTHDYTDSGLEDPLAYIPVTQTQIKGKGELVVYAELGYNDLVGETISETSIVAGGSTICVNNQYSLVKEDGEKYIFVEDIYFVPKESLL